MTIEDRFAIHELCYAFGYHFDRGSIADWADCFTPDGVFDESEIGEGLKVGREELIAYGTAGRAAFEHTFHNVTGIYLNELTGDTARATVYTIADVQGDDAGHIRVQCLYEDELARTATGWKFAKRVVRRTLDPEFVPTQTREWTGSGAPAR